MSDYVRFQQITKEDVIAYMRLDEVSEDESKLLDTILPAAKSFVLSYTGRTGEQADTFPEMTIAAYAVASDMFDKRAFQINAAQENEVVMSILGARSVNLL